MKSSLKIILSAISLLSTVLVSAAAAPAASKITTIDYIVDEEVMADSEGFFEEIEIPQISNDYELYEVKDEALKPTKFKEKPTEEVMPDKQTSSQKPSSSSSQKPSSSSQGSTSQKPSSSQGGSGASSQVAPPQNTEHSSFFNMLPLNRDTQTPAPAVNYLSYNIAPKYSENGVEILKFKSGSTTYSLPVKEALKHVVANEVNNALTLEAIKAQVVATHTYIKYYNDSGSIPSVGYKKTIPSKVDQAVEEVYNIIATYNGKAIYSPYHACSSGSTQASKEVWGGARAYLVAVESKYDYLADYTNGVKNKSNYLATKTLSVDTVKSKIQSKLGVTPSGDPSTWFKFLDKASGGYTSGNYVGKIVVAGKTTTGKTVRDMLGLRSACFDVKYSNGSFVFTTKGYGHGAGMSQWGAHFYAIKQGWNFEKIICHYYKGVTLAKIG